jgi:hypothetical protein
MQAMIDNLDVAILTKVNDLAERHGFVPTDFVATIQDDDAGRTVLAYETAPDADRDKERRFDAMLDSIGVSKDGTLVGASEEIYAALTAALAKAPKPRVRR